jgi:hypothetical protein
MIYCRTGAENLFPALCEIYNKSYLPLKSGANLHQCSSAELRAAARLVGKSSVLALSVVLTLTHSAPVYFNRMMFRGGSQNCEMRLLCSLFLSVCLSVRPTALNNLAPTERTFIKCDI